MSQSNNNTQQSGINLGSKTQIGTSQVWVPRMGIGGGSSFIRAGQETQALIDSALSKGLFHFDTAPLYGGGESEKRLGAALKNTPRNQYVLSTKVGRERVGDDEYVFDYSATAIRHSVQRSLERLNTNYLDIVFIHDVDPAMLGTDFDVKYEQAIHEAYFELDAMRKSGQIGAIGVGLADWKIALKMAQTIDIDCIMLAGGYTLLEHRSFTDLLPWCDKNQVSVLLAAPFNTGILAVGAVEGARYFYQPAPPDIIHRTQRIERICSRFNVALAAAALQFPLHHPSISSVVVGHERPSEIDHNVLLLNTRIPTEFWEELKTEGLLPQAVPTH